MSKTETWTGALSDDLAAASNWNDVTDAQNPAAAPPGSADTANIGNAATLAGSLTVGTLNTSGSVTLQGALTAASQINDGGQLLVTGSITGQGAYDFIDSASGTAQATVSGTGAAWTDTALVVGQSGAGLLSAAGGGLVTSGSLAVGQLGGSHGSVVIGNGGTIYATGSGFGAVIVGNAAGASGSVTITAGGTLEQTGGLDPQDYHFVIGNAAGATGVVTVTGTGALLTTGGNPMQVGNNGTGTLSVLNGATAIAGVSSDNATLAVTGLAIGSNAGAYGAVVVDGAGSTLAVTGEAYLGHAGTGTLTVSNSASMTAGDTVFGVYVGIGSQLGSGGSGNASVTTGGHLTSLDDIGVGLGGDTGTLGVASGGVVTADGFIEVGVTKTINGTATPGTGVVEIGAGGTLRGLGANITASGTSEIYVGLGAGSVGTIDVSGTGALLDGGAHRIAVGSGGTGSLTVSAGGTALAGISFSTDAAANIGTGGGTGYVTVSDANSTFSATGQVNIGNGGTGHLLVENGATMLTGGSTLSTAQGFVLGAGSLGPGFATITGAGSELINTGRFNVGGNGSANSATGSVGSLTIANGALVQTSRAGSSPANPAVDIAVDPGTSGSSVTVTGTHSTWSISGEAVVGDVAAGALTISGGATVTATAMDLGLAASSSGDVAVSGTGSTLSVSGVLSLADAGTALLSIATGSSVSAGSVTLAGTSSILNMLGGTVSATGGVANSATLGGFGEVDAAISGTGSIVVAGAYALQLDAAVGSGQQVRFASNGTLSLSDPTDFAATISNFQQGDSITLSGVNGGTVAGNVLDLTENGTQVGTLQFASAVAGLAVSAAGVVTACFLQGTALQTPDGPRPVERLAEGDLLLTRDGPPKPIIWIGHRRFSVATHPDPDRIIPIRIRAGALGRGLPRHDLLLSPDHALFLDGWLVPAHLLINGLSILQEPAIAQGIYFHVELPLHDIIFAEGAAVESYLDTGDRRNAFEGQAMMLHPDFMPLSWEDACAPVLLTGLPLTRLRARLAARARQAAKAELRQDAATAR